MKTETTYRGKPRNAADRAYHVQMAALAEEHRVCHLDRATLLQRQRAIWDICYGEESA